MEVSEPRSFYWELQAIRLGGEKAPFTPQIFLPSKPLRDFRAKKISRRSTMLRALPHGRWARLTRAAGWCPPEREPQDAQPAERKPGRAGGKTHAERAQGATEGRHAPRPHRGARKHPRHARETTDRHDRPTDRQTTDRQTDRRIHPVPPPLVGPLRSVGAYSQVPGSRAHWNSRRAGERRRRQEAQTEPHTRRWQTTGGPPRHRRSAPA